jgi:hypothetical protein
MNFDNVFPAITLLAAIANLAVATSVYRHSRGVFDKASFALLVFAGIFLLRSVSRFGEFFDVPSAFTATIDFAVLISLGIFLFYVRDLVLGLAVARSKVESTRMEYDDALDSLERTIRTQGLDDLNRVSDLVHELETMVAGDERKRLIEIESLLERYRRTAIQS